MQKGTDFTYILVGVLIPNLLYFLREDYCGAYKIKPVLIDPFRFSRSSANHVIGLEFQPIG